MKEYIEPEIEIIEYSLLDIIARSTPLEETSGHDDWTDVSATDPDAFPEDSVPDIDVSTPSGFFDED
ncbi:MAG: hypothetical protein IJU14_06370 [Clostridia bacterium]|nr:hypothetical protein [Clostridia bacterium]